MTVCGVILAAIALWFAMGGLHFRSSHITCLSWNRDGSQLAAAYADGSIDLLTYDARGNVSVRRLVPPGPHYPVSHSMLIEALQRSPDGTMLAGSRRGGVTVWRLDTGVELMTWTDINNPLVNTVQVNNCKWRSDGSLLIYSILSDILVWDPGEGAPQKIGNHFFGFNQCLDLNGHSAPNTIDTRTSDEIVFYLAESRHKTSGSVQFSSPAANWVEEINPSFWMPSELFNLQQKRIVRNLYDSGFSGLERSISPDGSFIAFGTVIRLAPMAIANPLAIDLDAGLMVEVYCRVPGGRGWFHTASFPIPGTFRLFMGMVLGSEDLAFHWSPDSRYLALKYQCTGRAQGLRQGTMSSELIIWKVMAKKLVLHQVQDFSSGCSESIGKAVILPGTKLILATALPGKIAFHPDFRNLAESVQISLTQQEWYFSCIRAYPLQYEPNK
ncbi:MAG TPA: WD40 repeat domain-containing protein [Candidatus Methylacidiphilales bacterium]|nr:WD40 repeat domain-containing protein [Candidatus Methylacidiphilales bacterium]